MSAPEEVPGAEPVEPAEGEELVCSQCGMRGPDVAIHLCAPAQPATRPCPFCGGALDGSPAAPCVACRLPDTPMRRQLLTSWWGGLGLGVGAVFAYLILGQIVPGVVAGVLMMVDAGGQVPPNQVGAMLAPYLPWVVFFGTGVAAALVAGLHKVRWLAPSPQGFGWKGPGLKWTLLWVVGCTAACLGGQEGITWLQAQLGSQAQEQELLVQAAQTSGLAFSFAVALGAPVAEELIFRRMMFSYVQAGVGRPAAWVLTALAFALIHFNFTAFFLYVWMGLCFALAYERTGSVWGAISVHALNNTVALTYIS